MIQKMRLPARSIFNRGDRIRITIGEYHRDHGRLGTVVGFSYNPNLVRVRLDGQSERTIDAWHVDFIEKLEDGLDLHSPQ